MYTVTGVKQTSKNRPSRWILSTEEEFDIIVEYRYGFILISVNDEILHKNKLTSDHQDGELLWEEFLKYSEEFLPEEMIDFSTSKIK